MPNRRSLIDKPQIKMQASRFDAEGAEVRRENENKDFLKHFTAMSQNSLVMN